MKAVYLRTATDRIYGLIVTAQRENRKIDYILLTPQEYDELRRDNHRDFSYPSYGKSYSDICNATYDTVTLEDKRYPYNRPFRAAVEPVTFQGYRLVVAPAEYH
jgi:hypothetical protein